MRKIFDVNRVAACRVSVNAPSAPGQRSSKETFHAAVATLFDLTGLGIDFTSIAMSLTTSTTSQLEVLFKMLAGEILGSLVFDHSQQSIEGDCEVSLRSSSQQPPECVNCNRLKP